MPFSRFGIRLKLFAAFGSIALMSVVAGGVGWWSFTAVERRMADITRVNLPALASASRLAEESATVAAAAPALDAAENHSDRQERLDSVIRRAERLLALIGELKDRRGSDERMEWLRENAYAMIENLNIQNGLVAQRIDLRIRREAAVRALGEAHERFVAGLSPRIEAASERLARSAAELDGYIDQAVGEMSGGASGDLMALVDLRAEMAIAVLAVERAGAEWDLTRLNAQRQTFERSVDRMSSARARLAERPGAEGLTALVDRLIGLGGDGGDGGGDGGEAGVFAAQARLLDPATPEAERQPLSARISVLALEAERLWDRIMPNAQAAESDARNRIRRAGGQLRAQTTQAMEHLVNRDLQHFRAYLELAAAGNLTIGLLGEAASRPSIERLPVLFARFSAAGARLDDLLETLAAEDQDTTELVPLVEKLTSFGHGDYDLFALRSEELKVVAKSGALLAANRALADDLGRSAALVVAQVGADTDASGIGVERAIATGGALLATIAGISVAGAVLIVWLYVGRGISARLLRLAGAMRAIADGRVHTAIPTGGGDEISAMADALVVFRDATAQLRERTEDLRASEARLSSILAAAPFPIVISRLSGGRILYTNRIAREMFETGDLPFERIDVRDFYADVRDRDRFFARLAATDAVTDFEICLKSASGRRFWVLLSAVKTTFDGEPAMFTALKDISERKRVEEALRDALERTERAQKQLVESEKMAALGSLVAGVAHEINTPIGTALTAASLLSERTAAFRESFQAGQLRKAELQRYVQTADEAAGLVLSNIHRATELIQSFKQVAVDNASDQRRGFELRGYIGEVLASLKPRLRGTGVQVAVDCPAGIRMDSYPGALSQVLTNFVMNSLLHGFEEGHAGRITLTARLSTLQGPAPQGEAPGRNGGRAESRVELCYADDGKGIPAANLSKIFDPFFTTRRGSGGTGLGLHIVFNIVTQQLGGTIRVESAPGQGTRFILDLPLVAAEGTSGEEGGKGGASGILAEI